MSLRAFIRKIAGQAGKASRSKRGASSHVNTRLNKRRSHKAVRTQEDEEYASNASPIWDRTFFEDHHLDVPDEIRELYGEHK